MRIIILFWYDERKKWIFENSPTKGFQSLVHESIQYNSVTSNYEFFFLPSPPPSHPLVCVSKRRILKNHGILRGVARKFSVIADTKNVSWNIKRIVYEIMKLGYSIIFVLKFFSSLHYWYENLMNVYRSNPLPTRILVYKTTYFFFSHQYLYTTLGLSSVIVFLFFLIYVYCGVKQF